MASRIKARRSSRASYKGGHIHPRIFLTQTFLSQSIDRVHTLPPSRSLPRLHVKTTLPAAMYPIKSAGLLAFLLGSVQLW